jgi:nucleoside-triphosphatase
MNNCFLTGRPGAGKSTAIRRVTERLTCGIGGFKTVMAPAGAPGRFHIYILPYGADAAELVSLAPAALRDRATDGFRAFPEVFDREGTAILRASAGSGLIVMDELGFMEAEAFAFQQAVFDALDGDIPVLGVIKPARARIDTQFLRNIRARPDVRIIELAPDNREAVLETLRGEYCGGGIFK